MFTEFQFWVFTYLFELSIEVFVIVNILKTIDRRKSRARTESLQKSSNYLIESYAHRCRDEVGKLRMLVDSSSTTPKAHTIKESDLIIGSLRERLHEMRRDHAIMFELLTEESRKVLSSIIYVCEMLSKETLVSHKLMQEQIWQFHVAWSAFDDVVHRPGIEPSRPFGPENVAIADAIEKQGWNYDVRRVDFSKSP